MKKITLMLLLITVAFNINAQYGQRTYYYDTLSTESFAKGIISTVNSYSGLPVYAATGTISTFQPNLINRARFTKAKLAGTSINNRMYKLFKNTTEVASKSNAITESSGNFNLAGAVQSSVNPPIIPGGSDVLIMRTSVTGIPVTPRHIDLGGGYDEALCTKNSNYDSTKYLTCGYSIFQGVSRAFVMKHSSTGGTINWVRYFSLPCIGTAGNARATYLVDDPTSGAICVVGNITTSPTASCRQAFLMKMNRSGTITWLYIYSYPNGTGLDFNSIKPTEIANRYIITGTVGLLPPLNDRILLFRVNASGAAPVPVFTKIIYSNGPTPNYPIDYQQGLDVCERITPLGTFEYYVCGLTHYSFGSTDGVVFKTNNNGIPSRAKLYGATGSDQLNAIDWLNSIGTPGDGLASFGKFAYFGTAGTTLKDRSWLVKSYFNLLSGCNEVSDSVFYITTSLSSAVFQPNVLTAFAVDTLGYQYVNCLQNTLCWNTSLAGGSNVRIPAVQNESYSTGVKIYPNPFDGDEFNMDITSEIEMVAKIKITDATGKLVDESQAILYEGLNTVKVNMSENSKGWYVIQVTTFDGNFVSKLLRQ